MDNKRPSSGQHPATAKKESIKEKHDRSKG